MQSKDDLKLRVILDLTPSHDDANRLSLPSANLRAVIPSAGGFVSSTPSDIAPDLIRRDCRFGTLVPTIRNKFSELTTPWLV
jgi:hypothetical protein